MGRAGTPVPGLDVHTYSVALRGCIAAHVTYVHPRLVEDGRGVVFESVVEPATLELARALVEATGYNGQLSFDWRLGREGFTLLACKPGPSDGLFLLEAEELTSALFGMAPLAPHVVPAGRIRKDVVGLVRDMLAHWREAPRDLPHLLSGARDVFADRADPAPLLFHPWLAGG
jgi:hypothetical protein